MFDEWFRVHKERWLGPLASALGHWFSPLALTLFALMAGLAAAFAASQRLFLLGFALWVANRLLDGLDGTLARAQQRQSELGGYLDILLDFVVYAAIPIGITLALDTRTVWLVSLLLLAAFFVNAASWMYLAALLERRGAGAAARGELTSVTMPRGLVAGTETVVFYSLFLLLPSQYIGLASLMAAGVAVGILQRVVWAARHLTSER
jgi:phosphatidylglycerophosphate synthase